MATLNKYILLVLVLLLVFGPFSVVMSAPLIASPLDKVTNDSVPLPFSEGWDQGTFAYNNWVHSGNWSISIPTGNPFPSATYTGLPAKVNYNDTLQSIVLSASEYTCATIYLDFDFMLVDQNHTGAEFLTVEVRTDSVWKKLAEHSNSGGVAWTKQHIEIAHAKGRSFRIRFRAHGANSADILHWYVDNIHAYAICRPPLNLTVNQSQYQVMLSWTPPDCGYDGPIPQWIHWDDGINYNAIGCACVDPYDVAARWSSNQLDSLCGNTVTKISFFPSSAGGGDFRARIWQGNPPVMLVDDSLPSVVYGQWNIHEFSIPPLIDVSQDLLVGLQISNYSGWTMGCDEGHAIDGYGNMIYYQGVWSTLLESCPSCDYNWNIEAYVESLKSASKPVSIDNPGGTVNGGQMLLTAHKSNHSSYKFHDTGSKVLIKRSVLMGYNVWRTDSTGDTSTFHKINAALVTDTNYTDNFSDGSAGVYNYYVTAVMHDSATNTFLCESPGTNMLTVSVPAVGISNNLPGRLNIFPNPSTDIINVSSDLTINTLSIMNYTGREVYSRSNVNSKTARLNVSAFAAGIYFVKVTQDRGTGISKIMVVH